jgi:4,5-DOPA dioxygenase extradiol
MTQYIPPVFVSHGSPMLALQGGRAGRMLEALGRSLPRPEAILVASAHWDTPGPAVSTTGRPQTIHDFYGFPAELFELRYEPPGAAQLAHRAGQLLEARGLPCALEPRRGLDHGSWVPLRFLYPAADIPVAQVAIQSALGPAAAYALGQALAPLAQEGVLLLGSGSITHNFAELDWHAVADTGPPWVGEFVDWIAARIGEGDAASLLDYRRAAPHGARAHPTEDHMVPLHFAFGAGLGPGRRLAGGVTLATLSMDAFVFDGRVG